MLFLIKSALSLVVVAILAYGVFFVDLAGKPLFSHVAEIWSSPAIQTKVALVRDGVRNELEDRLAEAAERETRAAVRRQLGASTGAAEELDPGDRAALDDVIASD
jgi:hypothetical protein